MPCGLTSYSNARYCTVYGN